MPQSEDDHQARISGDSSTVELRVAAHASQLAAVRMVTESLALLHHRTLDTAADLKLAADEAASELLSRAVPDTELITRFSFGTSLLWVEISVTALGEPPSRSTFGWHVLSTLTDHVESRSEPAPGNDGARVMTIRFELSTGED